MDRRWFQLGCVLVALVFLGNVPNTAAQEEDEKLPARIAFQDERIRESSGLARSFRNPDAVWTHNDSGDSARLYLVGLKHGATRMTCELEGTRAKDWEDMASYERDERAMLVVGDVGSNRNDKRPRLLHFMDEPLIDPDPGKETRKLPVWATLEFQFEDGFPDCEALAVDGLAGEVWLTSKVRSGSCGVYRLELPVRAGSSEQIARRMATMKLPMVTAMDMSQDGRRMLFLTYTSVWEFRLPGAGAWAGHLKGRPDVILFSPIGKQVEAICYSRMERQFHISAEGRGATVWTRKLPK